MGPQTLLLIGIFAGVIVIFGVVALIMSKKKGKSSRLQGYAGGREDATAKDVELSEEKSEQLQQTLAARVLKPLSRMVPSGESNSKVVRQLVHAGIRRKGAAQLFMGAKAALCIALPLAIAGFMLWRAHSADRAVDIGKMLMYCPIGLVLGMLLPNMWLKRKVQGRQESIRFALPTALDLLVVCIESGLALDAAIVRVGKEIESSSPEFAEELALMNMEISAGKPREECLRNLGLRTGVEEVKALTARIIQSSKFGTNLARSLRIHAESLREKRQQEAEERAAKTTVQLLFPLVFFIFPALFVVILGPAVVKVMRGLL